MIKGIFNGINRSKITTLSNKEAKFKYLTYNIHRLVQLIMI
ncbi:hypothetical protein [Methanobrevibacter olleyae]|nr:hypothetical protein [Methanobrevibacter olleyae]